MTGIFNKYYLKRTLISAAMLLCTLNDQAQTNPLNSVYQYAVNVGNRQAYLWIPPGSKFVRGVIIALSNMLERNWLEDPIIRNTAAKEQLGIICTTIPPRAKYPVKVTVVAWQYGKSSAPAIQTAMPVAQIFYVIK
ncbi:MAG: hypothetical protein ABJB86_10375 [Bacteroidota bacterium]